MGWGVDNPQSSVCFLFLRVVCTVLFLLARVSQAIDFGVEFGLPPYIQEVLPKYISTDDDQLITITGYDFEYEDVTCEFSHNVAHPPFFSTVHFFLLAFHSGNIGYTSLFVV